MEFDYREEIRHAGAVVRQFSDQFGSERPELRAACIRAQTDIYTAERYIAALCRLPAAPPSPELVANVIKARKRPENPPEVWMGTMQDVVAQMDEQGPIRAAVLQHIDQLVASAGYATVDRVRAEATVTLILLLGSPQFLFMRDRMRMIINTLTAAISDPDGGAINRVQDAQGMMIKERLVTEETINLIRLRFRLENVATYEWRSAIQSPGFDVAKAAEMTLDLVCPGRKPQGNMARLLRIDGVALSGTDGRQKALDELTRLQIDAMSAKVITEQQLLDINRACMAKQENNDAK